MKASGVILMLVGLGVGFGLGCGSAPDRAVSDMTSIATFADAIEELDPLDRKHKLTNFLQGLTADNLPEVLEVIHSRLRFLGEEELELIMLAWARFDAEGAFTDTLSWPTHSQERAAAAAIAAWAHYDPENAVVGLHLVENLRLRGILKDDLVRGWINSPHKEGVSEFLAEMKPSLRRQKYITRLTEEYIRMGPEELMSWAESIPDDQAHKDYKAMAFEKAANTLASVDPIKASKWIERNLQGEYSSGAPLLVARRWQANDAKSAFEWVVSLPEYKGRERVIDQVFSDFLRKKPKAAESMIRNKAPAEYLDPAVRVLVKNNVKIEPSIAMDWAAFVHDPKLQDEIRVRVGRYWLRNDSDVAKAWLNESELPEKTIESIFEKRAAVDGSPAPPKLGPKAQARGAMGVGGKKSGPRAKPGPGVRARAGK